MEYFIVSTIMNFRFNPPLTRANAEIHDHDIPSSWRYALFGLLLEHDRLERHKWSRWFLLKCKDMKLIPAFIQNLTAPLSNATPSGLSSYSKLNHNFQHKVLKWSIIYRKWIRRLFLIVFTMTRSHQFTRKVSKMKMPVRNT